MVVAPVPGASGTAGSSPAQVRSFCNVALPTSWQDALSRGKVSASSVNGQMVTLAASDDGSSLFVQLSRPGWRGLVRLQDGGRTQTTLMVLADPADQQFIGGGFDGRWLVFAVGYDLRRTDDWTVHAWDSRVGGEPQKIADNRRAIKSPWIQPVVHRGKTSWIQGTEGLQAQVHLYDLASEGWSVPKPLVTAAAQRNERIEWPYVTGDLVSFGNGAAFFVADLRSGSYTQVTPEFGAIQAWGDALVVNYYGGGKTAAGGTSVVRASQLPPLPTCG